MIRKPTHKSTGDLMSTSLVCMRQNDLVSSAIREMALSAIRHLPIVDDKGRLVGLVSATDLEVGRRIAGDPELRTIMTRNLRTVTRETPAERAVEIMLEERIGSIPVVGPGDELVGIITSTDFLVVAYQALVGAPIERGSDEI